MKIHHLCVTLLSMTPQILLAAPLDAWARDVKVAPLLPADARHTMHSYYTANPESPDGQYVLYFSSTDPKAHVGEVRILERATGKERVLAENVHTEDAHRVACQQWISGGRRVAYHEVVGDTKWRVVVVDVETGEKKVVAEDRQLGFGSPNADLLPLYGMHWNPGEHRNLEIYDATTGETRVVLKAEDARAAYPEWFMATFGDKPVSIFFPVLSPDTKRVIFKLAAGSGGDTYRSKGASEREGIICYDLSENRFVWFNPRWGHPAWHPDSRRLLQVGYRIFDTDSDGDERIRGLPNLRGTHPSFSPADPSLMTADGMPKEGDDYAKDYMVIVADWASGRWHQIKRFENNNGAKSWRKSDPHPVFSADGNRIYFNVSEDGFTRLYVAEASTPKE